jgi:hypothetical protein
MFLTPRDNDLLYPVLGAVLTAPLLIMLTKKNHAVKYFFKKIAAICLKSQRN